jgi:L-ascorbate metabolism protein UlaG (beta-lactamase superfamily)
MTVALTYYGHSAVSIKVNSTFVLVDSFITENPQASVSHLSLESDYILVSHGHEDHVGGTISIAERTDATVVANFEKAN